MKTNSISMAAHFLVVTCLSVVLIANIQADVLTDDWLSEVLRMKKSPQSTDELKAKQQQVHIDRGGDGQGSSSSSDQAVVKEPSSLSYLLCLKPKDAAAKENSQSETHHYNWDACH